ncbi:hypothetical protein RB195_000225 [Necator americanus]|uniref:Uncharacterized protein n=1 Tax=Necator americanus TaxID=51031 RepID=A0ABR1DBM8_NECAM
MGGGSDDPYTIPTASLHRSALSAAACANVRVSCRLDPTIKATCVGIRHVQLGLLGLLLIQQFKNKTVNIVEQMISLNHQRVSL